MNAEVPMTFEEYARRYVRNASLGEVFRGYEEYLKRKHAEAERARLYARAVLPDEVDEDPPADACASAHVSVYVDETPNTMCVKFVVNGRPRERWNLRHAEWCAVYNALRMGQ